MRGRQRDAGYQKKGVTAALMDAAKRAQAPALEADPLDAKKSPSASRTGLCPGRRGWRKPVIGEQSAWSWPLPLGAAWLGAMPVAFVDRTAARPIMRHDLA